jgi:hypothetical protein
MLASGTFGGLVVSILASGTFGGLVVSMLASGTFVGLVVSMMASGTLGGLVVSMLASGIQERGFEPVAIGFFRTKNSTTFLPSYGKYSRLPNVADLRHVKRPLRFTWKLESQAKLTGHFSPISVLH